MQSGIVGYMLRPNKLEFMQGTDQDKIVEGLFNAFRINPFPKVALYPYLATDQLPGNRKSASFKDITNLECIGKVKCKMYIWIYERDFFQPFDVITLVLKEPAFVLDVGFFKDNITDYGKKFGYCKQAFGNKNLDYSCQAPLHMSFYHEANTLHRFESSLEHIFIELHVLQLCHLAAFDFKHNQPYRRWRFLGWSIHRSTNSAMLYHSKPLSGNSLIRLFCIKLKAALSFKDLINNAIQPFSNKNTIIVAYQARELCLVFSKNISDHSFSTSLQSDSVTPAFSQSFLHEMVSKNALDDTRLLNKTIKRNLLRATFVEPSLEQVGFLDLSDMFILIPQGLLVQITDDFNHVIVPRFSDCIMTIKGKMFPIVG
jgi:hypothetical protein